MIWRADPQPATAPAPALNPPEISTIDESSLAGGGGKDESDDDDVDAALIAATLVKKASSNAPQPPVQDDAAADGTAALGDFSDSDSDAAPEEQPIGNAIGEDFSDAESHVDGEAPIEEGHSQEPVQMPQKPCRDWIQTGQCRFGDRCRYQHDPMFKGKKRPAPPQPVQTPFDRDDMIGKLLYNEVRHEISDLVQVIDFLARSRWMENVELYPGHKQELENRIKVVDSQEAS